MPLSSAVYNVHSHCVHQCNQCINLLVLVLCYCLVFVLSTCCCLVSRLLGHCSSAAPPPPSPALRTPSHPPTPTSVQVVEELVGQAGAGGPHRSTLLLVSGDHGQTLGGDHGGGSPEEADSALVAIDLGALHNARDAAAAAAAGEEVAGEGAEGAGTEHQAAAAPNAVPAESGSSSSGRGGGGGGGGLLAPAACRSSCSCGVEGNQCAPDLQQTDLTPTLAALLGGLGCGRLRLGLEVVVVVVVGTVGGAAGAPASTLSWWA